MSASDREWDALYHELGIRAYRALFQESLWRYHGKIQWNCHASRIGEP